MSRQVLVVGPAIEPDAAMEQAFRRLGYTRTQRVGTAAEALDFAARDSVDILFLPLDAIDDAALAAVERVSRKDRHMGVVATGPRADQEYLLRAMRAGIQEFLVRPCSLEDLTAVVERLHRRAEVRQVSGQTYAIFSSKGGVGVSTTAVNLASALAMIHNESRVAVVDLAMPGGDVSLLLNAKPSYTIGDLAARIDRLDADMLFSALTPATDGVWVLAMPEAGNAMDAVDATVTSSVRRAAAPVVHLHADRLRTPAHRTLTRRAGRGGPRAAADGAQGTGVALDAAYDDGIPAARLPHRQALRGREPIPVFRRRVHRRRGAAAQRRHLLQHT